MLPAILWTLTTLWSFTFVLSDDEHICEDKEGIVPHPGECQLFYDCRYSYWKVPPLFVQHLFECPYPFLFSEDTNSCEWFEFVDCGKKEVPVSGCDYRLNRDPTRKPCSLDYPHCKGLPDGPNVIEPKIFTPSYAVCYKGRFLFEGTCPNDTKGAMQIFDPNTSKCAPMPW